MHCTIIPPYLLSRIAGLEDEDLQPAVLAARRALRDVDPLHRSRRIIPELPTPAPARAPTAAGDQAELVPAGPSRTISDAANTETLPGETVRTEDQDPTRDPAVDEAHDHLGSTYNLFADAYNRDSIDGRGMGLQATVHYGEQYENAFWNGSRMVFGDGDGVIFNRFTASITVVAHELTHGLTQFATDLIYRDQAGALNESLSDVFGALTQQHHLRQKTDEAGWLIGEAIFTDQVDGAALRSLKAPGTAYDDPRLGKDPQPATMDGYIETTDDNGGVHLNSGIPNHAFYLAASSLGGYAWERAGRIWYDAATTSQLPPTCDFAAFASATAAVAASRYGPESEEAGAVRQAWHDVGVEVQT